MLPDIPKTLLEDLERRFPERCPDLTWDDRRIWFEAGKRDLVRLLRTHFERQHNRNVQ